MLATNTGDTESAEEKLRWAFRLYDKDSSGVLESFMWFSMKSWFF